MHDDPVGGCAVSDYGHDEQHPSDVTKRLHNGLRDSGGMAPTALTRLGTAAELPKPLSTE